VISVLAHERCLVDPLERRTRAIDEAVVLARDACDRNALLDALTVRQIVSWWPGGTRDLLSTLPGVAASARELGRLDVALHLHCTAVGYAFELNRRADMEEHLAIARDVTETLRVPIQRLRIRALEIASMLVAGALDEAQGAAADAIPRIAAVAPQMAAHVSVTWRFVIARERGEHADVGGMLRDAVRSMPAAPPSLRAMLAEVCALEGDLAGAREQLDVLGADGFDGVHRDMLWLGVLTMCAAAAAAVGDRRLCSSLYELLAPWEGRNALLGLAAVDRPVSLLLGLLARTLERIDAAVGHFERAAEDARQFGAAPWEARALYERGSLLRSLGRADEARDSLRVALDLGDRYGGTWLTSHTRAELRAAGARPRRDRLAGPEALTAGELRVARLAAGGLTNAQICETLVLAPRTVETHLTQAYRKLGASRGELAAALNP
jgi:DNA-binding NarL/FixJ family response regulator